MRPVRGRLLTLMLSADDDMSHTQTSTTGSDVRGHRINYRRLVPYLPCRGGPPANSALDAALWVQPEIDELGPETTWCLLLAGRIILKAPASARRPTATAHLMFSLPAPEYQLLCLPGCVAAVAGRQSTVFTFAFAPQKTGRRKLPTRPGIFGGLIGI